MEQWANKKKSSVYQNKLILFLIKFGFVTCLATILKQLVGECI
jgi:hypothetical protein